jgi:hypothetical protein
MLTVMSPQVGALQVCSDTLTQSAGVIARVAQELYAANAALRTAAEAAGAFGGEVPQGPFADVCAEGRDALDQIWQTTTELSQTVAAAGMGYVTTDEGVVPADMLSPDA